MLEMELCLRLRIRIIMAVLRLMRSSSGKQLEQVIRKGRWLRYSGIHIIPIAIKLQYKEFCCYCNPVALNYAMAVVRKTKPVKTLISLFDETEEAISVVDLISRVKSQMNKTTVYRVLDRLENEGMVHSFIGKDGLTWYAPCDDCGLERHIDMHPHFQCTICSKMLCLPVDVRIPKVDNHYIESAEILLVGVCEDCRSDED